MGENVTKIVLVGAFDWLTRYIERRLKEMLPLVAKIVGEPMEFQVVRFPIDSLEAQQEGIPKLLVFRGGSVTEIEVSFEDVAEEVDVFVVNVVKDSDLVATVAG